MTSVVKKNIVANIVGNGCVAIVGLVSIPIYIRVLGIEAWGIVGLFTVLQEFIVILDLGLSAALNREMARLSVQPDATQEMRNVVRTLEVVYWTAAVLIGGIFFAFASPIAQHWIHAYRLAPDTILQAIRTMGLAIALQWPVGLYSGGLAGLQRQVLLSGLNAGFAIVRAFGAVLILWQISASLEAFFLWQIVVNGVFTVAAGAMLWRSLPPAEHDGRFAAHLLRRSWRFSAGMMGITIVSIILTQADKIVVSRMLSLEMFGYYVLAGTVAGGLYLFVQPIFTALYPRFTQLASLQDEATLKWLYHRSCQFLSVVLLSTSVVLALFSRQALFVWTGNVAAAASASPILTVLVIGTALNGLMHLPYALQLAYGWTRLAFQVNLAAIGILLPSVILLTLRFGPIGAASAWALLNSGYFLVGIQLCHRRLLRGEQWRWYSQDVGLPLGVALAAGLLCRPLIRIDSSRLQMVTVLVGITLFVSAVTALATPATRALLLDFHRRGFSAFRRLESGKARQDN